MRRGVSIEVVMLCYVMLDEQQSSCFRLQVAGLVLWVLRLGYWPVTLHLQRLAAAS